MAIKKNNRGAITASQVSKTLGIFRRTGRPQNVEDFNEETVLPVTWALHALAEREAGTRTAPISGALTESKGKLIENLKNFEVDAKTTHK